jgi:hypothetical protein
MDNLGTGCAADWVQVRGVEERLQAGIADAERQYQQGIAMGNAAETLRWYTVLVELHGVREELAMAECLVEETAAAPAESRQAAKRMTEFF